MTRRLFNLLAVLSLPACVAVAVLWVRSHRVDPRDRLPLPMLSSFVLSSDGGVGWNRRINGPASFADDWTCMGFGRSTTKYFVSHGAGRGWTIREWRVPHWFLVLLTAALPASWLLKSLRLPARGRGFDVNPARHTAGLQTVTVPRASGHASRSST